MKNLIIMMTCLFALSAHATDSEIVKTRKQLSGALNSTVKVLKHEYAIVDKDLKSAYSDSELIKSQAKNLAERSTKNEVNPVILDHGRASLPEKECKYDKQNLIWDGSKWKCVDVVIPKDCDKADDEYRYQKGDDGNYVCSKTAEGEPLNPFWKFRDYSDQCVSEASGLKKIYDCKYTNKQGNDIVIASSYCENADKEKEDIPFKSCAKDCSKYVKDVYYCGQLHAKLETGRSSYASGYTQMISGASKVDTRYEIEYRITCNDGAWIESGSMTPYHYQNKNAYICPTASSYSCQSYGSGWNLSGTTCYKSSYAYAAASCKIHQTSSSYSCHGSCTTGKTISHNGCIYVSSCPSGYSPAGSTCRKSTTQYKPAIKNGCPGGYHYNSRTGMCDYNI